MYQKNIYYFVNSNYLPQTNMFCIIKDMWRFEIKLKNLLYFLMKTSLSKTDRFILRVLLVVCFAYREMSLIDSPQNIGTLNAILFFTYVDILRELLPQHIK